MNRRKIAFIYLPIIAVIPILVGVYQTLHFLNWLLDFYWDFSWAVNFIQFSLFTLILCFIISLYERFCNWYRLVILSVLYANLSCHYHEYYPSIAFYNITNIVAISLIAIGIIGCLIHFGYQIKDFFRYVRTRSK
jgi:hypothetical protein